MTPGRRLRFIQLFVAEIGGWSQKPTGFFALHKCGDSLNLLFVRYTGPHWMRSRQANREKAEQNPSNAIFMTR
jgi:hypothetical protein